MPEPGIRPLDRPIPAVLREIVAASQRRVRVLHEGTSVAALEVEGQRYPKRSLVLALEKSSPAVIAEIKKASPSKGIFREDFDPATLATRYQEGRAAAFSVVTEPEFFHGSTDWMKTLRETNHLPILRKDFIVDPIQVSESAASGADAILLIARILTADQIATLAAAARRANLEVLFEAHDSADLAKIAPLKPDLVGINARNLDDFSVSMSLFETLYPEIPASALAVAESGLESHAQIRCLGSVGYRGFLVGETLIRSSDPAAQLRRLRGDPE